jgi:hypothetical protein
MAVRLATLEFDDNPAWRLAGVTGREAVVRPDLDLLKRDILDTIAALIERDKDSC